MAGLETVEPAAFRAAMARLAGAVTVITTDGPAGKRGMAATAVTSVTDTPANLLVCVNRSARSNALIKRNGVFTVNVLSAEQEALVAVFSSPADIDPFEQPDLWFAGSTGAPVLLGSLVSLDCVLDQIVNIGTHSLFVGTVVDVVIGGMARGLVYFDRACWPVGNQPDPA
ncbi:MAG: flavin reductase family protein [Alteraurantiacibacter sp.]